LAEKDYPKLSSTWASCTTRAKAVPRNYDEALKWYRKAAEQGNAKAQYSLA